MPNSYPRVFSDRLGCLNDFEAELEINKEVKPKIHKCRPASRKLNRQNAKREYNRTS